VDVADPPVLDAEVPVVVGQARVGLWYVPIMI
jgi:hypothetical protein